jgi:GT2 family glycosyltransferase
MSLAEPKVAVVVPVHGRLPLTVRFLESFRQVSYRRAEIVIVDDRSPDGSGAYLARHFPEVTVLPGDGSLWWGGGTNRGVRYALARRFDYVLTINNDACVRPDFLTFLVETAEANPHSVVGSRLNFLQDPGRVWAVGGYTNWEEYFILNLLDNDVPEQEVLARRCNPWPVEFLTGCGTLVPTSCYRRIGLYDDRMCPQYHADSEFTLRAGHNGYRVLVDLRAVVYNDVPHTCRLRHLFLRRSPFFWKPLLALHLRYCPTRHRLKSLCRQYGETLVDQLYPALPGDGDPPFIRLRKALRQVKHTVRRAAEKTSPALAEAVFRSQSSRAA